MNVAAPAETGQQLVTIPQDVALSVFTTEKAIEPFLASIRKELDAFTPDTTTAAGRKAIAAIAYKVAQSKTYLDGVGKALNDQQKEIPKKIDACRKHVRDTLDGWRDEVRKPLTDWEAAEETRVKNHTDAITVLNELSRTAPGLGSAALREGLAVIDAVVIGPACEEFEPDYTRARDAARSSLVEELTRAEIREAEASELAELRRKDAERTEADRQAATLRQLEEKPVERAPPAAQAQPATGQPVAQAPTAAPPAPAADPEVERRAAINRAAVAAFIAGGLTEGAAKKAVILIAKKTIPAITITY